MARKPERDLDLLELIDLRARRRLRKERQRVYDDLQEESLEPMMAEGPGDLFTMMVRQGLVV